MKHFYYLCLNHEMRATEDLEVVDEKQFPPCEY